MQNKEQTHNPLVGLSPAELERLKRDIYRPDMEKFRLFTKMLRTNALLKKAIIRHKSYFRSY